MPGFVVFAAIFYALQGFGLIGKGDICGFRQGVEMAQLVDAQLAEGDLASVLVDVNHADGMGVGFVAADVERTARIADNGSGVGDGFEGHAVVGVPDGLGLVDVAEGEVVVARAEAAGVLGLDLANLEVVAGGVHACHG